VPRVRHGKMSALVASIRPGINTQAYFTPPLETSDKMFCNIDPRSVGSPSPKSGPSRNTQGSIRVSQVRGCIKQLVEMSRFNTNFPAAFVHFLAAINSVS
jgi:hypothetical protein